MPNKPSASQQYKCTLIVSMIYICILFCSAVLGNKPVLTHYGVFSAASLLGPLWFILSDIVAEVYGIELSRKLLWSALACEFIFISLILLLIQLPSPINWNGQSAYNLVLGNLLRIYWSQFVAIIIAGNLNVYIITRWKILLQGKYFWLRSIGASGIGEALFSFISISLIMMGRISISGLLIMIIWSCFVKISYSIFFSYPATLVVNILKLIEKVDIYDNCSTFNPFKPSQNNV